MTNRFIISVDPTTLVPKSSARIYYYITFWIIVLQSAVIAFLWRSLPRVVPLFFTEPWGEARLAPRLFIWLIPVLSFLTLVINLTLGRWSKNESAVLSYTLAVSTLVVVTMLSIGLYGIAQSIL